MPQAGLQVYADNLDEVAEPTAVEASETCEALDESRLLRLPGRSVPPSLSQVKLLVVEKSPVGSSGLANSRSLRLHTILSHTSRMDSSDGSVTCRFMLIHPLWSLALAGTKPSLRYRALAALLVCATSSCISLQTKLGSLNSVCFRALANRRVATPCFWCDRATLMWEITI